MGGIFKKIDKAAGKLIGIDKDGAKKAANIQAQATRDAADQVSRDNLFAAQAASQQQDALRTAERARSTAADLLNRPMETASVDLSEGSTEEETDLLGRRRGGTRASYRGGQTGLVV